MAKFKSYPKYRESGLQWIKNIPEHWEVKKLKIFSNVQASNVDKKTVEDETPVLLCNYVDVYYNDKINSQIDFMKATAKEEQIQKFTLRKDDVLITKDSESPTDIAVPTWVEEDLEGVLCGYHLSLIRPNSHEMNGRYLYYSFETSGIKEQFWANANGVTRFGLSKDSINNALFFVPPLEEQKQIIYYLNEEISKIDSLIFEKKKIIKLFQEKKRSLVLEVVTKGLNPNSKMRESDIKWIGKIPEQWQIIKLKYLAHMKSGETITAEKIHEVGDYPVFGGGGLRGYTSDYTHNGEHVLIGRQGALCGNIKFAKDKFWASEHAVVVSANQGVNINWLGLLLESMNLNQYSVSAAQPGLSVSTIKNLLVPVPPKEEQQLISDFLQEKNTDIEEIINLTKQQIKELEEYRQSLIYEAVTGKIDVRDYEISVVS